MQLSDFSEQNGLKRPSIDYYAFRSLPYRQFQALQVLYALFYQLQSLPFCSDDIQVVRHKTRFWMGEIQAAYQGSPQHPLTQDLQKVLEYYPLAQKEWVNLITAIEMQTDGLLLEQEAEVIDYADKRYGSLYRLINTVRAGDIQHPLEALRNFAYARTLLSFLQEPGEVGVRVNLSDITPERVYTLFEQLNKQSLGPLGLLAKLYQHQAKEPMLKLGPLKTLWLSICERLSPTK